MRHAVASKMQTQRRFTAIAAYYEPMRVHHAVIGVVLVVACSGGGQNNSDGGTDGSIGDGSIGDGGVDSSGGDSGPAPIAGLRLFFSDLPSGPNTGGQNGKGAFVTIWGNGFGATQAASTVTIGGGAADNYPIWTNTKITFQLGSAAQTGDIVVHVANKGDSNALPFTVRAGNIYFVTSGGSNGANGSFGTPWQTIPKAKNSLAVGDIAYLGTSSGDQVSQTTLDNFNACLSMDANDSANSGTAAAPKALIAYPGAKVTIGVESGVERGILTPAITGTFDYWVISQLTLRGQSKPSISKAAPRVGGSSATTSRVRTARA